MSQHTSVNVMLSRPKQPVLASQLDENSPYYEVQLAFALVGLDKSDLFSPFFPLHRLIASKLIEYFMSIDSQEQLLKVAQYGHDNINPNLFNYALSMAILNRPDTKNLLVMSPAETFPDKFFPAPTFQEAIQELNTVPEGSRRSIVVDIQPLSAANYNESRLEYFRLDLGVNLCYYFWHLTHPFEAERIEMVDMDRRGELWCYFHQQIIARYNAERYCNSLLPVEPLANFDEPIEQGFYPKLTTRHLAHSWSPRMQNSLISDLQRPYEGLMVTKTQFQRWIDRVCNAIDAGFAVDTNLSHIPLNNDKGIDILGNMLQSSILSPNRKYYGDISNIGHAFIAYCHDPSNLNLQSYGVMGEPATCMRDMAFYRWYAYIMQIVQFHKTQQPIYTKDELGFDGIKITSLNVVNSSDGTKNHLKTFWDESDFNLKNGLDFEPDGNIYVRAKHLQHENFQYVFDIQNDTSTPQKGTARIFMAQKSDFRSRDLTFEELRRLMIELDRFEVNLSPGNNHIVRKSSESAVTVPYKNYYEPEVLRQKIESKATGTSWYCLSGWPSNLLIPKGTPYGTDFIVFAMISKDDEIEEAPTNNNDDVYDKCVNGSSYCGLRNRKYPDKRSMGFPFDRPTHLETLTIKRFLLPNMATQTVSIQFSAKKSKP